MTAGGTYEANIFCTNSAWCAAFRMAVFPSTVLLSKASLMYSLHTSTGVSMPAPLVRFTT